MPKAMVKGQPLRQEIAVLEELAGPQRFAQLVAGMPDAFREQYEKGLLSSAWYPVDWVAELYALAIPLIPEEPNLPERVSRIGIERDMRGVYKFLTKFVSPEMVARFTPRILGTYYKGPEAEILLQEPGHYRFFVKKCFGFDRNVWRDLAGATERLFEQVGAKNVRATITVGGGDGDAAAQLDVTWE